MCQYYYINQYNKIIMAGIPPFSYFSHTAPSSFDPPVGAIGNTPFFGQGKPNAGYAQNAYSQNNGTNHFGTGATDPNSEINIAVFLSKEKWNPQDTGMFSNKIFAFDLI